MVSFFPGYYMDKNRKVYVAILAFVLCAGVTAGGFWATDTCDSFHVLLQNAPVVDVSFVNLSIYLSLLILISCLSIFMNQPWMIILLALYKGLSLGIIGVGMALSFLPAGGMISFLFLFSDILSFPLLIWFWIHPFSSVQKLCYSGVFVLFLSLFINYLNVQYISSFLVDLFRI